jgi:hypothetical protein
MLKGLVSSTAVSLLLPRTLLGLLAAIVLSELVVITPRPIVAVLTAVGAWMALPGVLLARRLWLSRRPAGPAAWFLGPALGFGFSVFGVFLLWAAGVHGWPALVGGPMLTVLLAEVVRRYGGPTLKVPAFDRRDVVAVAVVLLIVPAVTWAPYDHVRQPVADGEAYRAYFTADFVWAMTVTSELAKGDVPPANPFLNEGHLNYYWLAHFLSGALYRNVAAWGVTSEQVILTNGLWYGLAFIPFFYALIRIAGASPAFAALGVAVAFLANSYEGLDRMMWLREHGHGLENLRNVNIDAVTRWFYDAMPVDGLQRLLLYQPHHLTGYVMALCALWLVGMAERPAELAVAVWSGIFLAMAFLFSTFSGVLVGAAVAALFAVRLAVQREYQALVASGIVCGGLALIGVLLTQVLVYTDPSAGVMMTVGLNSVAVRHWPFALVLSFGPLLLAGVAGLLRLAWIRRQGSAAATLVIVSFAFYFLVDVPDMDGVWVGWRSGHQLLIAFAAIGAAACTAAWTVRRFRPVLVGVVILSVAPALPTVVTDVYNAQDIENRGYATTFPWTLVISPNERQALDWLKHATPPDARVQFDPHSRGVTYWAYLPAFAERRMSAGLPGAMIPFSKYREATENVRMGIFRATTVKEAFAMTEYLGIDYIYVGDIERHDYGPAIDAMMGRPDLYPIVFSNKAVTIFGVAGAN